MAAIINIAKQLTAAYDEQKLTGLDRRGDAQRGRHGENLAAGFPRPCVPASALTRAISS